MNKFAPFVECSWLFQRVPGGFYLAAAALVGGFFGGYTKKLGEKAAELTVQNVEQRFTPTNTREKGLDEAPKNQTTNYAGPQKRDDSPRDLAGFHYKWESIHIVLARPLL